MITSLFSGETELDFAAGGGLVGVGTTMPLHLCQADGMVGQVLTLAEELLEYHVYCRLEIECAILRRLVGSHVKEGEKKARIRKLAKGETLLLTIGAATVGGIVEATKANSARIHLLQPVCARLEQRFFLSRRINRSWRLIGWAVIQGGTVQPESHPI